MDQDILQLVSLGDEPHHGLFDTPVLDIQRSFALFCWKPQPALRARENRLRALCARERQQVTSPSSERETPGYEPFVCERDNRLRALRMRERQQVTSPLCARSARIAFLGRIDRLMDLSGRGTTRAGDSQGTPTQSHISPSVLVYEDKIDPFSKHIHLYKHVHSLYIYKWIVQMRVRTDRLTSNPSIAKAEANVR